MKISTSKTEVFYLSRSSVQCSLQIGNASMRQVKKFKYLGVAFMSDGRQDRKLDVRSDKSSAVIIQLFHHLVVLKKGRTLGIYIDICPRIMNLG